MKYKAQFNKKKLGTIPDDKVLTSWFNDLNGTQAKKVKRLDDVDGNLTLELDNITDERLASTKGFIKTFGECPESGCVEKDKDGNWRVISNKTGKYWPQTYDSEQDAKDAIKAYHANKGFSDMNMKYIFRILAKNSDRVEKILNDNGIENSIDLNPTVNVTAWGDYDKIDKLLKSKGIEVFSDQTKKDRKSFANRVQRPDKDTVEAISAKFKDPNEFVYLYNAYMMGRLKDKDQDMYNWFESMPEDKLDAANEYYLVNERIKGFAKELQSIRRRCSTDSQKKAFNDLLEAFRGCK